MRTARQSAIRLLKLMMVASVVLPAVLFVFASWLNYRHVNAVADERIERSLDILHEHALKVFQTVDRAIAEVEEVVRGLPDAAIKSDQQRLHLRFKQIVEAVPQVQAIIVVDRDGSPLVSSAQPTVPPDATARDRAYFQAHAAGGSGTMISGLLTPRWGALGSRFFNLSRERPSADGSFNGIIAIAVLPGYFEEFYARIGRSPGVLYAMARDDGAFLARYPAQTNPTRGLDSSSALRQEVAKGRDNGYYTVESQIDNVDRRIGYRKLIGFPVYVIAGTEISAIHAELFSTMASHLIFGLPATLLLFSILVLALKRTRRLYDEAERREAAEGALRQAQRLEAIGQLTGGVAHDFNNLLMVVSGSVQRLRRDLSGEKHTRILDMITTATQRGESLTRQLLAFSRQQMLMPAVIDLTKHLPELKEMLNRSLRGDIETEVLVPQMVCAVKVDPSELELALLNLAVNARDAMPGSGTLSIAIRPMVLRGKATEEGLKGQFIAIRVADTGSGIPPDVLPHVFEPFFTTKEIGKGTGLGLSQVYGFAKQSGGTVTVTSILGRGTVITLYLPRTREAPAPAAAQAESGPTLPPAGTVLLVEDNDEVAEVCKAYLQQFGYVSKRASGAQEALEIMENDTTIDLVVSDILMPGFMNGLELAQAIRERFPRMPILMSTGYASSAQDAVRQGFVVLQKPFDIATLEQGLREVLRWKERQDADQPQRAAVV
jgi:two-component system NtrC family sensor kinase